MLCRVQMKTKECHESKIMNDPVYLDSIKEKMILYSWDGCEAHLGRVWACQDRVDKGPWRRAGVCEFPWGLGSIDLGGGGPFTSHVLLCRFRIVTCSQRAGASGHSDGGSKMSPAEPCSRPGSIHVVAGPQCPLPGVFARPALDRLLVPVCCSLSARPGPDLRDAGCVQRTPFQLGVLAPPQGDAVWSLNPQS